MCCNGLHKLVPLLVVTMVIIALQFVCETNGQMYHYSQGWAPGKRNGRTPIRYSTRHRGHFLNQELLRKFQDSLKSKARENVALKQPIANSKDFSNKEMEPPNVIEHSNNMNLQPSDRCEMKPSVLAVIAKLSQMEARRIARECSDRTDQLLQQLFQPGWVKHNNRVPNKN